MKITDVEYTIKKFKVPSKSNEGEYHLVELTNEGKLYCDCLAGIFFKKCSHAKIIEKHLKQYGKKTRTNKTTKPMGRKMA